MEHGKSSNLELGASQKLLPSWHVHCEHQLLLFAGHTEFVCTLKTMRLAILTSLCLGWDAIDTFKNGKLHIKQLHDTPAPNNGFNSPQNASGKLHNKCFVGFRAPGQNRNWIPQHLVVFMLSCHNSEPVPSSPPADTQLVMRNKRAVPHPRLPRDCRLA